MMRSGYDFCEEAGFETPTKDRQRLSRRYLLQQDVPDTRISNRGSLMGGGHSMSVGPADRQQERALLRTAAHSPVKLCTPAWHKSHQSHSC